MSSTATAAGGTVATRFATGRRFPLLRRCDPIPLQRWIGLLIVADLAGLVGVGRFLAEPVAHRLPLRDAALLLGVGWLLAAWGIAAAAQRLYRREAFVSGLRRQLARLGAALALAFGIVLVPAYALSLDDSLPPSRLFAGAAAGFVLMAAFRALWCRSLRAQLAGGRCLERALVLSGAPVPTEEAALMLERQTGGEVRVLATAPLPGRPGAPSLEWVELLVQSGIVGHVFLAGCAEAAAEANALLARLARLAVDVTIIPDFAAVKAPVLRVDRIGMQPVVDVNLRPLTTAQVFVKRAEDVVLAGAVLALGLPLFVLICLAIRLDSPGPIFFRQWRTGFHDRRFRVWKFRTMHHRMRDEAAVRQTSRGDARVTRIGRLLRRSSLDELPQLLNVLSGEMSIVGPRPHALGMTAVNRPLDDVIADYSARHRMKPGITGWAQVNGCRGEVDTAEKLRRRVWLDCEYIASWSLALDLWIMLRTLLVLVTDKDAY